MGPGQVISENQKIKDCRRSADPLPPMRTGNEPFAEPLQPPYPEKLAGQKERKESEKGANPRQPLKEQSSPHTSDLSHFHARLVNLLGAAAYDKTPL